MTYKFEWYFKIFLEENFRQLVDSTKYFRGEKKSQQSYTKPFGEQKIFQIIHLSSYFLIVFSYFKISKREHLPTLLMRLCDILLIKKLAYFLLNQ